MKALAHIHNGKRFSYEYAVGEDRTVFYRSMTYDQKLMQTKRTGWMGLPQMSYIDGVAKQLLESVDKGDSMVPLNGEMFLVERVNRLRLPKVAA